MQIDTISVVERAHHHILHTRVPNYTPAMLHKLQSHRREVFEYWFHAAACLPISDYRYCLSIMKGFRETRTIDTRLKNQILARIRAEGPLMSKNFEAPPGHKSGGWWGVGNEPLVHFSLYEITPKTLVLDQDKVHSFAAITCSIGLFRFFQTHPPQFRDGILLIYD